jgi:fatty-acyl-CoA synthase
MARHLIDRGITSGDRVGLLFDKSPDTYVAMLAVMKVNAAYVPLDAAFPIERIRFIVGDAEMSAIVTTSCFAQRLSALDVDTILVDSDTRAIDGQAADPLTGVAPPIEPLCYIIYTSGTTGNPKGCLHAHRTFATNATVNARHKGLSAGDRIISSVPFFNVFGLLNCILEACVTGATIVIQPTFDTADALGLIARERVTVFLGTPTMWIRMEEHPTFSPEAVATLRAGSIGGSPIPPGLLERWRARGCEIAVIYGMSEAPTILLDGRPTPGLEIEITADGELRTRGYNHLLGYFRDEAATAERIQEGWLNTGDIAEIDSQGRVHVVGRADDMIIVGGFNVQPAEVEQALREHPAVSDAAAFGLPEREYGEIVAAWIVLRAGAAYDEEQLREFCRGRLAKYKVPQHVRVVEEFPLTPNGKVQRFRMQQAMLAELGRRAPARGSARGGS